MSFWASLHPKVKAALIAAGVIILGSIPVELHGTLSLRDTIIADITAVIPVFIGYMKSGPDTPTPPAKPIA